MASFSMKQQQHDDPWLNPSVGLELMQNMGLAGSGSQPVPGLPLCYCMPHCWRRERCTTPPGAAG
jgi:hypothetical protein